MQSLKNKVEFDFVCQNGKKYFAKGFNLYIYPLSSSLNKTLSYKERRVFLTFKALEEKTFLGLSVSKKIGSAPVRNKIKRRFRAFCRLNSLSLKGYALVFVAKDFKNLDYQMIEKEATKAIASQAR